MNATLEKNPTSPEKLNTDCKKFLRKITTIKDEGVVAIMDLILKHLYECDKIEDVEITTANEILKKCDCKDGFCIMTTNSQEYLFGIEEIQLKREDDKILLVIKCTKQTRTYDPQKIDRIV